MAEVAAAGAFAVLRYRNFRLLWAGLLVSNAGSWMQTVAQSWLVLELSNNPFYLGLIGFTRALPLVVLSLLGGTVADRLDRRRVLFVTQAVMTVQSLALWALTYTGYVRVWHVIALAAVNAAAQAFDQPARHALIPQLVPKEELLGALSLNAVAFNGASVFGPSLAGPVVATFGIAGCFLINAVSFAAIFLALLRMDGVAAGGAGGGQRSLLADLGAGLAYVRDTPVIQALLAMAALTSLTARPYVQFLSVFARDVLGTGVGGYGLLQAAPGLGTIFFSLWQARRGDRGDKGQRLLLAGVAFALALLFFAWSRRYWLSFTLLVVVGGMNTTFMTNTNTLIQQNTADGMRGRVISLYTMTALAMMPLGQMPMGAMVNAVGPVYALSVGAVAALLAVLLVTVRVPRVLRLP